MAMLVSILPRRAGMWWPCHNELVRPNDGLLRNYDNNVPVYA